MRVVVRQGFYCISIVGAVFFSLLDNVNCIFSLATMASLSTTLLVIVPIDVF